MVPPATSRVSSGRANCSILFPGKGTGPAGAGFLASSGVPALAHATDTSTSENYTLSESTITGSGGTAGSENFDVTVTLADVSGDTGDPNQSGGGINSGNNPTDSDNDGYTDNYDSCQYVPNPTALLQRDTDGDGYGNLCDADLDNSQMVNTLDFGLFKQAFGRTGDLLDADFNLDGIVNTLDFGMFKQMFGKPPGPSLLAQ